VSDSQWQPPGDWDLGTWSSGLDGPPPASRRPATAPLWKRALAIFIDNGLLYGLTVLVGLQATSSNVVADLRVLSELALSFCYFGYLNGVMGQTVGKRVMGIRCVDAETGEVIGFRRGLTRYAVVAVLGLAFLIPAFIDALSPLWDVRRQAWHDKAARSIVVTVS